MVPCVGQGTFMLNIAVTAAPKQYIENWREMYFYFEVRYRKEIHNNWQRKYMLTFQKYDVISPRAGHHCPLFFLLLQNHRRNYAINLPFD